MHNRNTNLERSQQIILFSNLEGELALYVSVGYEGCLKKIIAFLGIHLQPEIASVFTLH